MLDPKIGGNMHNNSNKNFKRLMSMSLFSGLFLAEAITRCLSELEAG